jgi:hypothetical protein
MSKISGDCLIGFGDFFEVGAAKPTHKPGKPMKVGKKKYPASPAKHGNSVVEQHGRILHKAHDTAHKSATVQAIAMKALAKPVAGGRKAVHVGAAAAAAMTPKQRAAVSAHNAAVVTAARAAHALAQHALASKKSLATLAHHMINQKKVAVLLRAPAMGHTHVGHLLSNPDTREEAMVILGEYYTAIGADPDPNNPGFLTDGTPDPAYAGTGAGTTDASTNGAAPSDGPVGDAIDSGAVLPAPPDMGTLIPNATLAGGIMYNGAKGTPEGYVGSYGLFTRATDIGAEPDTAQIEGTAHFGYVWGQYDKKDPANGGVGWGSHLAKSTWNHIHGRFWLGDDSWQNTVDPAEAFASNTHNSDVNAPGAHLSGYLAGSPAATSYGPLVGNPAIPDFVHMRVDSQGNMFWLPQEAPDWLTFPLKQAAALTAQADAKAAADAAKTAAAAQAKAAADAAAAQAAQNAQNALAESQAASQATQAQSQATAEQAGVETQAQQAIVQQSQADVAAQQAQTEQAKQAGALLLTDAQQQLAYAQAHPEEAYAGDEGAEGAEGDDEGNVMAEGEPPQPGMEGGGAEGDYDDGAPVPGGEVMLSYEDAEDAARTQAGDRP